MTTEKLYLHNAAGLFEWLDENPTAPFTLERRWAEAQLASKLELIADKAADEDDAAYQAGYDEGRYEGKELAEEDLQQEIRELEEEIEDLRAEIRDLEDQAANAFAEGFEAGSKDMS